MRVLILSCNTGEGHNACAKAIKEVFDANGDLCVIADALALISDRTSHILSRGHVFIYRRLPHVFDTGYSFFERHTGLFGCGSAMYALFSKGADRLYEAVRNGGYDAVICTHPFAALMLTETMRRHSLTAKTALVATDYTCCPSVKDSELDIYFIPDEALTDDFECPHIPKDKMVASGIPIKQDFYRPKTCASEPRAKYHVVIMCGSMGCGPIDRLTELFTYENEDVFLTVICGTNEKLRARMLKKYGKKNNLSICGYENDMIRVLDSTDLYLTKPGGISTTEAAARGVPMALINAVGGCEDYNRRFFVSRGMAFSAESTDELEKKCREALIERTETDSSANYEIKNSAAIIYSTLSAAVKT